uniref:Cytochrome c biogenesis protein CcsB n=1 Tax=Inkyuleea mariana TaxID=123988 RepID=A0A4D6WZT3_9FLOR|nr:cytochrome c biogenesis protein ccs1 [Inkyuleea mariana]
MKFLNTKNMVWNTTKKLGNLNFSILMLLLIACLSILGSIIEQDQPLIYYQMNYPIYDQWIFHFNWQIITYFGLDHIYATWWFLFILVLFCFSLMICTFSRQLPSLKNARNWKFLQRINDKQKVTDFTSLYNKSLINLIYSLNYKNYYVFHKNKSLYGYKGILGRIAPIFVHISIILTLLGSLIGLFGGFVSQEMIPNGETFHIKNLIKSGLQSTLPINLIGRIDNFLIEYNSDNSVKQFFSEISLLNYNGNSIFKKKISVNSPLVFRGITFYQTDWKIDSLRLRIGNSKIIQRKLDKVQIDNNFFWICNLPIDLNDQVSFIIVGLNQKILVYDSIGKIINSINFNEKIDINNTSLVILEIMASTGLQIKMDPGIIIVYTGFLFLMISTIISYLSYSQIWVNIKYCNIELSGSTNRAILTFEEDFIAIQNKYIEYTSL